MVGLRRLRRSIQHMHRSRHWSAAKRPCTGDGWPIGFATRFCIIRSRCWTGVLDEGGMIFLADLSRRRGQRMAKLHSAFTSRRVDLAHAHQSAFVDTDRSLRCQTHVLASQLLACQDPAPPLAPEVWFLAPCLLACLHSEIAVAFAWKRRGTLFASWECTLFACAAPSCANGGGLTAGGAGKGARTCMLLGYSH